MINLNGNVSSVPNSLTSLASKSPAQTEKTNFPKFVNKYISEADDLQKDSDKAIKEFLSGKNQDITSVVAAVAKADMSFKLMVSVRDKIIEAYKQTMRMSL